MSNALNSREGKEFALFLERLASCEKIGWMERNGKKVYVLRGDGTEHEYSMGQIKNYRLLVQKAEEVRINFNGAAEEAKKLADYLRTVLQPKDMEKTSS